MNKHKLQAAPSLALTLFLVFTSAFPTPAQNRACPTFYIAASGRFVHSEMIALRGASNLPPGSILIVDIYDYIGEGSKTFNNDVTVVVDHRGFFEANITPKKGMSFRTNLICDVAFLPRYPKQPVEVIRTVGRRGERLGFPDNPQAGTNSGGHYLNEMTIVWD